jgi:hypothetical protein
MILPNYRSIALSAEPGEQLLIYHITDSLRCHTRIKRRVDVFQHIFRQHSNAFHLQHLRTLLLIAPVDLGKMMFAATGRRIIRDRNGWM